MRDEWQRQARERREKMREALACAGDTEEAPMLAAATICAHSAAIGRQRYDVPIQGRQLAEKVSGPAGARQVRASACACAGVCECVNARRSEGRANVRRC